jgi:hypothetical protein
VLVEVHPGVQTAGLLVRRTVVAPRLERVQGTGDLGEEPERVEVRAADAVTLEDLVRPRSTEPQRPVMAYVGGPVDRRPLVQPEAAQGCRFVEISRPSTSSRSLLRTCFSWRRRN